MEHYGFLRVGVATPQVHLGDPLANAEEMGKLLKEAEEKGVSLLVFPELSLTGYTCGDLFFQESLRKGALKGLRYLLEITRFHYQGMAVVGLPLELGQGLYNCAALLYKGQILGVVPKIHLPNYKEFYERRWFVPGGSYPPRRIPLLQGETWFGNHLLFAAQDLPSFTLGVEICEDLWVPLPPSTILAQAGATVIANLSASDEYVGKAPYRRALVCNQSARTITAYLYSAAGLGESSTDLVYGGHSMIAENGLLLKEAPRFQREPTLLYADIDLDRLVVDRQQMTSFQDSARSFEDAGVVVVPFSFSERKEIIHLERSVPAQPFVPEDESTLKERCEEIFTIQCVALARRLQHVEPPRITLGVSGGLDSTLALLVTCEAVDSLHWQRERIHAYILPGFGTSSRTLSHARRITQHLGVTVQELDIRPLAFALLKALGHKPFGIEIAAKTLEEFLESLANLPPSSREDLLFENVQARVRTQILMNAGFMVGTGDLSELALGFCTYGGDHLSMYNPNAGVPKTLVRHVVRWAKEERFRGSPVAEILEDVLATPISPELLPLGEGEVQATEKILGPYELHDFFLYYFLRYGYPPGKILFLARHARFSRDYTPEEIRGYLRIFLTRFFTHQFKRSTLPDGPKVGSVSLSPRGDFRMPSDATVQQWLRELEDRP